MYVYCIFVSYIVFLFIDTYVYSGEEFSFPPTKMLPVRVCLCAAANSQYGHEIEEEP